ncbi:MAG: hypothetical protein IIC84_06090 [Chloroflexi bacterium]|nr:hypothetical protein [Chloroflexota bacterium]
MMTTMDRNELVATEVETTRAALVVVEEAEEIVAHRRSKVGYFWGLLRLSLGWTFFWGFIDKLFGLGFATGSEGAWINGGSPTNGFLAFATKGPLAEFYGGMAGNAVVDWMFMIGLLVIGLPLLLGVGVKLAGYVGAAMLMLMYTAGFIFPEHNPFMDEHIVYAIIMIGLTVAGAGRYLGLGGIWTRTKLVKKYPILE